MALAAAIRRIAEAILRDERAILTVSTPISGPYGLENTCLSLPCIVGAQGVERVLPVNLPGKRGRAPAPLGGNHPRAVRAGRPSAGFALLKKARP